ncbi:hypothetical protein D3C81_1713780 [compost metagenome]
MLRRFLPGGLVAVAARNHGMIFEFDHADGMNVRLCGERFQYILRLGGDLRIFSVCIDVFQNSLVKG